MDYRRKNVVIAGYGVEGRAAYTYLIERGANVVVYDQNERLAAAEGMDVVLGKDAFTKIKDVDVIFRSPSIRPDALPNGVYTTSVTRQFFEDCPATIIGVTGTKGKGTTATLIANILTQSGHKVHLVGNIGKAALEVLGEIGEDDVVVYELSSFQLWDLEKSPHIAVVLMVETDHIDIHKDMDEYVAAKSKITANQTQDDMVFYHPKNEYSEQIAEHTKGTKARYLTDEAAYIEDDFSETYLVIGTTAIMSTSDIALPGKHNLENVCAALSAAWQFTNDAQAVAKAIREFTGLPHRLELVRELNTIRFYNDSFAAAPAATVAAIESFPENEKVCIVGGYDKGIDLTSIVDSVIKNDVTAILIGQTGLNLQSSLREKDYHKLKYVEGGMEEIAYAAVDMANPNSVIILSPGCASFDMFKDFKDRGEQFRSVVMGMIE